MDDVSRSAIEDIDASHWVAFEFSREWPKYVLDWSIRERRGDTDFPLAGGRLERMPPTGGQADVDELWESMRDEARGEAEAAMAQIDPEEGAKPSFLARLFGRR